MALRSAVLALMIVLVWGVNFVVIRWGLEELPPLLMGALRYLLCALPAIFFIRPPAIPLKWLLGYGLTISFGQFALLFSAIQLGMPAGLASLVLQAQVLFSMLLAVLLLGEQLRSHNYLAILVAGGGMTMLALQAGGNMTLIGFVLTLAAALSWAAGNIINRQIGQLGDINLLALVVWGALIPPLPFLLASYWLEGPELIISSLTAASWQSVAVVAFLAWAATLFGYGGWAWLLKHNPVSRVTPLTLLVPVVGLFSGWWLLDETLTGLQLVGIGLVMLGLLVNVAGAPLLARLSSVSRAADWQAASAPDQSAARHSRQSR